MKLLNIVYIFTLVCGIYSENVDIFEAVKKDSEQEIRTAIDSGVDVNIIGAGGQTPLMNAVLSGKLNAVNTLLTLGADTTIGEKDGYVPIHGACFQGRAEIAQALIDHGVDASIQHRDGFMPIHRACWGQEKRHTDTVRVLLENGVPRDQKAANGETPIIAAKKMGNKKTVKLLEKWKGKEEL